MIHTIVLMQRTVTRTYPEIIIQAAALQFPEMLERFNNQIYKNFGSNVMELGGVTGAWFHKDKFEDDMKRFAHEVAENSGRATSLVYSVHPEGNAFPLTIEAYDPAD